jgi:GH15 family glucan-1,4-alpha-glucosidase
MVAQGYLPIAAHGAIGNLHTAALVAADGGIDWWCPPEFDRPSVFAAILDTSRGGRFRVSARGATAQRQGYLHHTNILETVHEVGRARLRIADFMPVRGNLDHGAPDAPAEIVRVLTADGRVTVDLEWSPRFDYGRDEVAIEAGDGGFVATGMASGARLGLAGVPEGAVIDAGETGPVVRASFELEDGERIALAIRWDADDLAIALDPALAALEETAAAWKDWVRKEEATGDRSWAGAWAEDVIRSELALKLLTFAPTGAIVAAATTSLPEWIGGIRNWDYRYSWIRDSALAAQALYALGHRTEAEAFIRWSERSARDEGEEDWGLRIVYGIRGGKCLPERELEHLEGYARSGPVRIGNGAVDQLQLDIYGELISAAYEVLRMGGELPDDILRFLPRVVDEGLHRWREPDYGIWEVRNGPDQFVYSKAMVWMALDRGIRMVDEGMLAGDTTRWQAARSEIATHVLENGYDPDLGAFTQRFGSGTLDASNLLLPLMEIIPFSDPRVQSTIDRTLQDLTEQDLVYRYKADDGLPGEEGAFGLCTFWLVDALALSGRLDEAYRVFDGMTSRANEAGLFSEQIDPANGEFLGNFPQAFTHMGLINSALYLAHMEGRETPVPDPIGSEGHRGGR